MKTVFKSLRFIFSFLCIYTLGVVPAVLYAQEPAPVSQLTDTLPESAYHLDVPRHIVNIYSNFVPYILFGIVIALMLFVSFRYWYDNRDHNNLTHAPH